MYRKPKFPYPPNGTIRGKLCDVKGESFLKKVRLFTWLHIGDNSLTYSWIFLVVVGDNYSSWIVAVISYEAVSD